MVKTKIRGISLMSALLLITMVMLIAATMAGVFTLNVNITNRVSNSSVALSEAEAGLAEVLYQITRDENIEGDGNQENPKITWGLNGETVQGTITPGMQPDEAYHVVTFDTSSSYPYSTNNTTLDNDSGYDGRVVPDGMLHIISTGYCKGQYRTIECVVEKPPFPFGLATSGLIDSETPMRVLGTSSQAGYSPGEEDRPGHLLCNSPEGVKIGKKDGFTTEISGFVKSSGQVDIEQPAVVRGGIQSFAEVSELVDIDIQDFDLAGEPGVVEIVDNLYSEDQVLDVMYRYSGPGVRYAGDVELQQAMLYIDGDLTIDGELKGEGLIVVTGNVRLNSGTELRGSDKMALLAGGNITVDGEVDADGKSNYFSGLVYTEGNLNAKNITIVGNAVVNSQDPSKGNAILENVTMISNEETGDMTIHITSTSDPGKAYDGGHGELFSFNNINADPNHPDTQWLTPQTPDDDLRWIARNQLFDQVMGPAFADDPSLMVPELTIPPGVGDAGQFYDRLNGLIADATAAEAEWDDMVAEIKSKEEEIAALSPPGDEDDEDRISDLQSQIAAIETQQESMQLAAETAFIEGAEAMLFDMRAWTGQNASVNGTVVSEITQDIIEMDVRFNLNEYLPQSERVKMSFWKVYPRRM